MTRLKDFLFKYKHAIIILYMPIYLFLFMTLEKRTNVHFTEIHCKIDDYIPFCEIFIIPYLLWFLYVAVSLLYLFFQTKHLDDFYRCCAVLLLGMTTSLIIYTVFPNAQTMRPKTFDHSNIFTTIIDILYRTDTDTNVFPSIHVFNSVAIHFGISRSYYFRNVDNTNIVKSDKIRKAIKIIRLSSLILCILICISTLTLKQHSFLDLVGGCALFAFYYTIIYIRPFRQSKLSTDC